MEEFLATLPVGYVFNPTDEELINDYLFNKINNINLSDVQNMIVPVCDLYGHQEPWELWAQNKFLSITDDLYCFTQLKKKPNSSRISRSVGKGTWHGEDKGMPIDSNIEARKKRFNYKNKNSAHHCHWILHEYSLVNVSTNWVLCRLKNNYVYDDNGTPVEKRKIREADDQCLVYSEKRLKIDDHQGFESDVGFVNSDMGFKTTDDEAFNSNDAAGIVISEQDNVSDAEFVNLDMGFKTTDDQVVEVGNQGFESDVGFVNSDMGFKNTDEDFNSNDAAGILLSELDNGFLGCHDLQGYDFIANADHSEFGFDGEFPLTDCGSINLSFSVDELFGYDQSFDQGGISYSDLASQRGQN